MTQRIKFQCSKCERTITTDACHAGRKGKCSVCGAQIEVPQSSIESEYQNDRAGQTSDHSDSIEQDLPTMPPHFEAALLRCARLYLLREYSQCGERCLALLRKGTSPELIMMFINSMLHQGEMGKELVNGLYPKVILPRVEKHPWLKSLALMSLGKIELSEVVLQAPDTVERIRAYYWAGVRYEILELHEKAQECYDACHSEAKKDEGIPIEFGFIAEGA